MAVLAVFVILTHILFSNGNLQLPSPWWQTPAVRPTEPRKKSNIRQLLLENLNTFAEGNGEKLEILGQHRDHKLSSDNEKRYKIEKKPQETVVRADQHPLGTSGAQVSRRKISRRFRKSNTTRGNSTGQHDGIDNDDEWRKTRDRRLRFYKAFRKIQDLHRKRSRQISTTMDERTNRIIGNTSTTMIVSHRRKKDEEMSADPTNVTLNDWETFITDYSKIMPQYNRRSTTFGEYEVSDISNQFLNGSDINGPPGYLPPLRILQSPGSASIARNPFAYQQLLTNLNSVQETLAGTEASERLPPPPNPRSTEASVHTVQVYPPQQQQQPNSVYYQSTGSYQNTIPSSVNYNQKYNGYPGTAGVERQIPNVVSNDYEGEMPYMVEADAGCIPPCEAAAVDEEPFVPEDERCSNPRLKQIILQNIVERDAEASKRLIYSVCEDELGAPCNVICGTGFYSYIARATQFCLASAFDVSCYAFVPACDLNTNFASKRTVRRRLTKKS